LKIELVLVTHFVSSALLPPPKRPPPRTANSDLRVLPPNAPIGNDEELLKETEDAIDRQQLRTDTTTDNLIMMIAANEQTKHEARNNDDDV
jgi:hypothetical protein